MAAPAELPRLEPLARLSPYVTRLLGPNPGKFTLQGTNSYLVQHPRSRALLLIDTTGPSTASPLPASALGAYTAHLGRALDAHPAQPAHVSDILLTHWHSDHVHALPDVLAALAARGPAPRPPRVWKLPCATPNPPAPGFLWNGEDGKDAEIEHALQGAVRKGWLTLPPPSQKPPTAAAAVWPLSAGQRFVLGPDTDPDHLRDSSPSITGHTEEDPGRLEGVELEVVHTPGHTSDSICLVLHRTTPSPPSAEVEVEVEKEEPAPPRRPRGRPAEEETPLALFTADTVLGHGSSVFSSHSAYMDSLARLAALLPGGSAPPPHPAQDNSDHPDRERLPEGTEEKEERKVKVVLYPGHGAPVENAAAHIAEYIRHRQEREAQVVAALRELTIGGPPPALSANNEGDADPAGEDDHDARGEGAPGGSRTPRVRARTVTAKELVKHIYPPSLPDSLLPAAVHALRLHLGKLLEEGNVERVPAVTLSLSAAGAGTSSAAAAVPFENEEGEGDGWRWVGGDAQL